MNIYFKLLAKPVFTVEYVNQYYNNMNSARSAIKRLMKENMVAKIRNNLYTCISGETGQPVASRYQIACSITPTAYISHHTAMEYYGMTNQVFYDVYVSSETSFRSFEFNGYTYHYVSSSTMAGIEKPAFGGGICVANLERTTIDSIKDMDKISGMEEVFENIASINHLDEKLLIDYLKYFNNQFLYQKVGFILSIHKEHLNLSEKLFKKCQSKIGKSKRYLSRDLKTGVYNNEWKLVVPRYLNKNNGVANDTI